MISVDECEGTTHVATFINQETNVTIQSSPACQLGSNIEH